MSEAEGLNEATLTPAAGSPGAATCPACEKALEWTGRGPGWMNREQWDATKAGEYFTPDCTSAGCPGRLHENGNRYFGEIAARAEGRPATPSAAGVDFQERVRPWMMACFGPEITADKLERNDRFIEEALELVQAGDYPKERALALVDYVYDRPQGDINQDVGGVMITLAAHCLAHGVDMHQAGETELARIWTKVDQIRAKQAAKPTGSALPIAGASPPPTEGDPAGSGSNFDPHIHVPGVWRCAKCSFRLIQSNLNARDGTVTARDEAGAPCPNCAVPLWRVTWREEAEDAVKSEEAIWERGLAAGKRYTINALPCGLCALGFAPFNAEKIMWHQVNGRDPFRCPATSTDQGEA